MADFGDDPFADQVAQIEPLTPPLAFDDVSEAPPLTPPGAPIDLSEFEEGVAAALPAEEPTAADHAAHDVVQLSSAESQAAFIGGYTPAPIEAPAVPASPSANDPRILWRKKNQELLAKLDKDEAAAKKAASEHGKSHIKKFNEDRTKKLDAKKKANRQAQTASPEAGVPNGTTWEKVNLLIKSQQDKAHTKDLSRFKACLANCKATNAPAAILSK